MACNGVNSVELIENEKAKEFHSKNLTKFMSTYRSTLADSFSAKSTDKSNELKAKAEAMRVAYNAKLRKFCEN